MKPEDGKPTKLEVKVAGRPKPKVRWLRHGEEITPSEEYQIENFEDGTSILFINNVYPDDTGSITFEAHNALGVAVTTTELSVKGISEDIHILICFFKLFNAVSISSKRRHFLSFLIFQLILVFPISSLCL